VLAGAPRFRPLKRTLRVSSRKGVLHLAREGIADGVDRGRAVAEELAHRCHLPVGEAARDDQVEVGEICIHVQGDTVEAGAAADADAEGADFRGGAGGIVGRDPDADGGIVLAGRDREVGEGGDDDVLQSANVPPYRQTVVDHADDGVGDELAGAVEGDVAAAVGGDDVDAEGGEVLHRRADVALAAGPAAEGDHGRVLDEQEVLFAPGDDLVMQLFLEGPSLAVRHGAEVADDHWGIVVARFSRWTGFASRLHSRRVVVNFDEFDAILLDLDGTIYHEEHALPGAIELIRRLERERRRFACLTNSTSSPARIAARLQRMGVGLAEQAIYTAGAAAVDYVLGLGKENEDGGWKMEDSANASAPSSILHSPSSPSIDPPSSPSRKRVYSLATEGVHDLLEGRVQWVQGPDEPCDVVLVGTPTSVYATEERQRVALEILRRNSRERTRLVGICADRVYPSPRGIEFGSGALTAMLAYAADVTPVFTGKPERVFFEELCRRLGVVCERCLLIGDNLESDIAGGKAVGMRTVLVLTGVTRREDLEAVPAQRRPDAVIGDLREV
jgi:HAD superfamily hydrolase (TIGR01450 family)